MTRVRSTGKVQVTWVRSTREGQMVRVRSTGQRQTPSPDDMAGVMSAAGSFMVIQAS